MKGYSSVFAWGGSGCENTWLYHLISVKGYVSLPSFVVGLWDPFNSARLGKKCVFNPLNMSLEDGKQRSAPPSQSEAYHMTFGKELDGAHYAQADETALNDVLAAQPTLFATRLLVGGVKSWAELYGTKEARRAATFAETKRGVPDPWRDGEDAATTTDKEYSGPAYGPKGDGAKPLDPVLLFLLFIPLRVLSLYARLSNQSATEDWVINDNNGKRGARGRFRVCRATDAGAQHRCSKWYTMDKWSILCFIGILIARGALRTRNVDSIWSQGDGFELAVPWIASVMTRDVFRQHLRYIKFADNMRPPHPESSSWTPYWKVQHV